jgi:hypothetical protein
MFLHHSACRGPQHVARRSGLSIADKLLDFVSLSGQQRAADANAKSRPRKSKRQRERDRQQKVNFAVAAVGEEPDTS